MKNKDSGAFPLSVAMNSSGDSSASFDFEGGAGLTKREWFAGMAMQALISTGSYNNPKELKETAQNMADLMLEEKDSE